MKGTWNIMGLNDLSKQLEVANIIAQYKLIAVGILKTRVKQENIRMLKGLGLKEWSMVSNVGNCKINRIRVTFLYN